MIGKMKILNCCSKWCTRKTAFRQVQCRLTLCRWIHVSYQCEQWHKLSGDQCQTNRHNLLSYQCQHGHKSSYKCQHGHKSSYKCQHGHKSSFKCLHGHKSSYKCQHRHKLLINQCQTNGHNLLIYQCQHGHKLLINQC